MSRKSWFFGMVLTSVLVGCTPPPPPAPVDAPPIPPGRGAASENPADGSNAPAAPAKKSGRTPGA